MRALQLIAGVVCAACAISAQASVAGGHTEEWRILGPAASDHDSLDGAAIVTPAATLDVCTQYDDGLGPTVALPYLVPGQPQAPGSAPGAYVYYRQPAPLVCKRAYSPAVRAWRTARSYAMRSGARSSYRRVACLS